MEVLLKYIRSLADFSDESWALLQQALSEAYYQKNEFLLKEGQVASTLFFVVKGYCRAFLQVDGVEKNTNFFFENEIAASLASTINQETSRHSIIACEPMTVIRLDKIKLMMIADQAPEIERMGRHFIKAFAVRQGEFSDLIRNYSLEERLEYFEREHQEKLQRIPLSQLASFLGATRESLSRIRQQRMQKGK